MWSTTQAAVGVVLCLCGGGGERDGHSCPMDVCGGEGSKFWVIQQCFNQVLGFNCAQFPFLWGVLGGPGLREGRHSATNHDLKRMC